VTTRRTFITLLGGAAAWPLALHAQQGAMPVVGFVSNNAPDTTPPSLKAFRDGLAANGFVDGRNVTIEYRFAAGRLELLLSMVMELVRRQVSILCTSGGDVPGLIAKGATSTIPIVFLTAADPIRSGLVISLNRPDRNATGATLLGGALGAKRLEFLRELMPKAGTVGILANANNPNSEPETADVQAAARSVGNQIHILQAGNAQEIENAFEKLAQIKADGMLVNPDPRFMIQREQIVALANRLGKPVIYYSREYPEVGGLMSYGARFAGLYRQGGEYVARILHGAKPADLPVVQPTKFDLVINQKAALALGLSMPPSLLARADEVIE
jgi:putative tryptophan/tyrosine transport system substrate-binding protein